MASLPDPARYPAKPWKWAFWFGLIALSLWYVQDTVFYAFSAEASKGESFLARTIWRLSHAVVAIPLLIIAPLQFSRRLRGRWPRLHRRSGQFYLVGALIGSLLAVYLGATIKYEGSRIPLVLFGMVWFAFSVIAWQCARRKDFVNHARFVIRGYALSMAFVWVRIMYDFQTELFPFIDNVEVRDTTREWLSLAVPLLVTETWLSWWPVAKRLFGFRSA